jgi:hypothetical protein
VSPRSPVHSSFARFALALLAFVLMILGFFALGTARGAWGASQEAVALGFATMALVLFLCAFACCLKIASRERSAWAGKRRDAIASGPASPPRARAQRDLADPEALQAEMGLLQALLAADAPARHRKARWMRIGLIVLTVLMFATIMAAGLSGP